MRLGGGVYFRDAQLARAREPAARVRAERHRARHETPTAGYNLLKAELSYTRKLENARPGEPSEFTVGVVGNNLLNEDIRNRVSYTKDEVLMPGASVRAFANVKF